MTHRFAQRLLLLQALLLLIGTQMPGAWRAGIEGTLITLYILMLPNSAPPLVVDLDGSLVKTDLLAETASQFVLAQPRRFFKLLGWLMQGKSTLKSHLAQNTSIDASALPYNQELLIWLQQEKTQGRSIVLATASHRVLAEQVADHLGLFDEVLATDASTPEFIS
jgi:hypothetical protein